MSNKNDSCVINPMATNNNGESIPSPLFEDLKQLCKGDENKARDIWSRIDNDANRKQIASLPPELVEYYPNTNEYSLFMYMMVSDASKEIDETDLKDFLTEKYKLTDLNAKSHEALDNAHEFLISRWSELFGLKINVSSDRSTVSYEIVQDNPTTNKLKNEILAQKELSDALRPVLDALGIPQYRVDEMAKLGREPSWFAYQQPLSIASILVKLMKYFENTNVSQSIPREVGLILKNIGVNNPLYNRIMNYIDSRYKEFVKQEELDKYTEEEAKTIAFCNLIALVLNGRTIYKHPQLENLIERYLYSISNIFINLKKYQIPNTPFESGVTLENLQTAVVTSFSKNGVTDLFNTNPEMKAKSLIDERIRRINKTIKDIVENTTRLISTVEKLESRSNINTDAIPIVDEEGNDIIDFRRDVLAGLDRLTFALKRNMESTDIIELRKSLNTSLEYLQGLLQYLSNEMESIATIDFKTSTINPAIAERLRDYKLACQYIESIIDTYRQLQSYEEDVLKSTPKDQLQSFKNRVIVTEDVKGVLDSAESLTTRFKDFYIKSMKSILIAELTPIFNEDKISDKDGNEFTLEEFIEHASNENIDDLGLDRWMSSMAMCSNGILSMIAQYKKRVQRVGVDMTDEMRNSILAAAENLRKSQHSKNTDFMFVRNKLGKITNEYIMDYDQKAFIEAREEYIKYLEETYPENYEKIREKLDEWDEANTEDRPDIDGKRHPSNTIYKNKDYEKLTDAQKAYWKTFMSIKGTLERQFPNIHFAISNAIIVRKDFGENLLSTSNIKGRVRRMWEDAFKFTSADIELYEEGNVDFKGNPIYLLPIYYSRLRTDETMDDVSKDTTSSLIQYANIMNRSAALSNVIAVLEGAEDILESFHSTNTPTVSFLDLLTGNQKTSGVEYVTSRAYSFAQKVIKRKEDRNDISLYRDWLRRQVYGKWSTKKKYKIVNTLANAYMKFTAIKTLALKLGTAIANNFQAFAQALPEAIGGNQFNVGNLGHALLTYVTHLIPLTRDNILRDIGSNVMKSKFNLFSRKLNIMQDFDSDIKDMDYRKNRFRRIMNDGILFVLMHMGEHMIQHQTAFATIYNKRNKLTTKEGNKINAYDAYDYIVEDGIPKLKLKEGLTFKYKGKIRKIVTLDEMLERRAIFIAENPNKPYTEKEVLKENEVSESFWCDHLSELILGSNQYMHGIYNKEDSNALTKYTVGTMFMMYRKYLYPSFKRRYGQRTYNAQLGRQTEGYYSTTTRVAKELAFLKSRKKYKYENLTEAEKNRISATLVGQKNHLGKLITVSNVDEEFNRLPKKAQVEIILGEKNITRAVINSLSEWEKGNIKTFLAEQFMFMLTAASNLLFIFSDDDDDNENSFWISELKYQLRRSQTEQAAMNVYTFIPSTIWTLTSLILRNTTDLELGKVDWMGSEFIKIVNEPIVGWSALSNTYGRGVNWYNYATLDLWKEPYQGNIKRYKNYSGLITGFKPKRLSKNEARLLNDFKFLDWQGQIDPQSIEQQSRYYFNM